MTHKDVKISFKKIKMDILGEKRVKWPKIAISDLTYWMTHLTDHVIMILYSKTENNAKNQIDIGQFNLYVSQGTRTF